MSPASRVFGLVVALLFDVHRLLAQSYSVTDIGTLALAFDPAWNSYATAINTSGQVAFYCEAGNPVHHSYLYSGGKVIDIGTLGGQIIFANGINDSGSVVGVSRTINDFLFGGPDHPFVYSNGKMTDLGTLGGDSSAASAINNSGQVVGYSTLQIGQSLNQRHAFLYSNGKMTDLGTLGGNTSRATAINNSGQIVGESSLPSGLLHAFLYSNGRMTDLGTLGGAVSSAVGINDSGQIIGSSESSDGKTHPFLYSNGQMIDLWAVIGEPVYGINNYGDIVGDYVVYSNGKTYDLIPMISDPSIHLLGARRINDAGQIIGWGTDKDGPYFGRALLLTPIPTKPAVSSAPQSQTIVAGATVSFSVTATGSLRLTYQWQKNGIPIGGATSPVYTINSAQVTDAGAYAVVVSNGAGSVTSSAASLVVATPSRLINLSILTILSTASDSFTMGYVVGGADTSGAKPLVIRAAGPSLGALGVPGTLADPKIELFAGSVKTGENDNWGGTSSIVTAMASVGAFAYNSATSKDAAAAASVTTRDNSVKVSSADNGTGTVIAEIYDATPTASFTTSTPRLINVSVLKNIGSSLTAGFVVGGSTSRTVLIRAVGPTLGATPFSVPSVLADPQLTLFSGQTVIGTNDNWGTPVGAGAASVAQLSAAFTQVGAFALTSGSKDAAILAALAPGNYTVQVSGVSNTTGVALVEVYEVP